MKVILSGEGSDELSGSYLYFHKAPSPKDFQDECLRLVKDVQYFDVRISIVFWILLAGLKEIIKK